jgi:hypothetical protein
MGWLKEDNVVLITMLTAMVAALATMVAMFSKAF